VHASILTKLKYGRYKESRNSVFEDAHHQKRNSIHTNEIFKPKNSIKYDVEK